MWVHESLFAFTGRGFTERWHCQEITVVQKSTTGFILMQADKITCFFIETKELKTSDD